MKARDVLLCAAILAFGATAAYASYHRQHSFPAATPGTSLTGSSTSSIPSGAEVFSARLGQRIESDGIAATPIALIQDSRCPVGVQCIQAGTVEVSVKLENGPASLTQTFALGTPISIAGITGTLIAVSPDKQSGNAIPPADYVFTFQVVP